LQGFSPIPAEISSHLYDVAIPEFASELQEALSATVNISCAVRFSAKPQAI
jgi:hypothetical protein